VRAQLRGIVGPRNSPARIHAAGLLGCYVFVFHHLSIRKLRKGWDYPLHWWPLDGLSLGSAEVSRLSTTVVHHFRRSHHDCLFKDVAIHPWRSATQSVPSRLPCGQLDTLIPPRIHRLTGRTLARSFPTWLAEAPSIMPLSRIVGSDFALSWALHASLDNQPGRALPAVEWPFEPPYAARPMPEFCRPGRVQSSRPSVARRPSALNLPPRAWLPPRTRGLGLEYNTGSLSMRSGRRYRYRRVMQLASRVFTHSSSYLAQKA